MATKRPVLKFGRKPQVAGVLCSLRGAFPPPGPAPDCDLVEVRLDVAGCPRNWLEKCQAIEAAGWPVLLTLRLAAEGGRWTGEDEARLAYFEPAIEHLAAVDVEWQSPIAEIVARRAREAGKVCVMSFHDFQRTPPAKELQSIIRDAEKKASVVKLATKLRSEEDQRVLKSLLKKKWRTPLCVIGMGPEFAQTRVRFLKLGSCLGYGYLDKPTAPGQWSALEMKELLRRPAGQPQGSTPPESNSKRAR